MLLLHQHLSSCLNTSAAWYITRLVITSTPKVVIFSFLFSCLDVKHVSQMGEWLPCHAEQAMYIWCAYHAGYIHLTRVLTFSSSRRSLARSWARLVRAWSVSLMLTCIRSSWASCAVRRPLSSAPSSAHLCCSACRQQAINVRQQSNPGNPNSQSTVMQNVLLDCLTSQVRHLPVLQQSCCWHSSDSKHTLAASGATTVHNIRCKQSLRLSLV